MTVVRNHTISRVADAPMWLDAKWGFSDSAFSGTNRNFHVYVRPIDGGGERRLYTVPDNDQCWSDEETQGDRGWVVFEDRFFPVGTNRVTRVEHHVQMQAHNGADDGQTDIREWRYSEPVDPLLELVQTEARLSCKIDARESAMKDNDVYQQGYYRTRTIYWVESRLEGQGWPSRSRYGFVTDQNFTEGSHTYNPDPASIGITSLKPARPIMFRFCARNEGPSGASEIAYSETYVFAAVRPPSIKEVRVDGAQTVFRYTTSADEFHPIDGVRLEKKVASSASSGSYSAVNKWQKDVLSLDTMFDANGTEGLDEDMAVFYRIATFHSDEAQNVEYGMPNNPVRAAAPKAPSEVEVTEGVSTSVSWKRNSACSPKYLVALYVRTESGTDVYRRTVDDAQEGDTMTCVFAEVDTREALTVYATVQASKDWGGMAGARTSAVVESDHAVVPYIDSIELLEDGLSIRVSETHDADGWDCTEYSWHTREDGWESTKEPDTHDVSNATASSHVVIVDLEDGVEYFVRARRKNSKTGEYGLYSSIVSTRTGVTPGQPILSAPSSVAAGRGIELTWDFRGSTQASALLTLTHDLDRVDSFIGDGQTDEFALSVPPDTDPTVDVDGVGTSAFSYDSETGVLTMDEAPADGSILRASYSSEGEEAAVEVEGSEQGYVYQTDPSWSGTVTAKVRVTCGGKWSADSDEVSIDVVQPPLCSVAASGSLEDGDGYGGHILTALPLTLDLGGTGDMWEVTLTTANGTNEPTPAGPNRVEAGSVVGTYRSTVSGDNDVVSATGVIATGGQYDVSVVCIDSATGSRSAPAKIAFVAQWENPALEPTVSVRLANGRAYVTASRDESDTTSKLSLWRRTADGAIKCVDDAGDGIEYIDDVPPYKWDGCAYVAMVTTVDGDIRWVDAAYTYVNSGLTVDFDGNQVVLPFNIGFDDGYSNEFESRAHMDGHRSGYWEPGVDRTSSVSGQLPKKAYAEAVYALRQLGRYSGIAFVRDVLGIAFPCHVDVSVSTSYDSSIWDVDLSITEVDDDGTWALYAGAVPKDGE